MRVSLVSPSWDLQSWDLLVGTFVGASVGASVGVSVGASVGVSVGTFVGTSVGTSVGVFVVGVSVGTVVGVVVGSERRFICWGLRRGFCCWNVCGRIGRYFCRCNSYLAYLLFNSPRTTRSRNLCMPLLVNLRMESERL